MWHQQNIQGMFDGSNGVDEAGAVIRLAGWVLSKPGGIPQLDFTINGDPVFADVEWIERPDVHAVHSGYDRTLNSRPGFIADISAMLFKPGVLDVRAIARVGSLRVKLGRVVLPDFQGQLAPIPSGLTAGSTKPFPGLHQQIVFLHIPKTAGTSLNAYFRAQFPPGQRALHIESLNLEKPGLRADLSAKKLIAGHLDYRRMAGLVDRDRAYWITLLRDPAAQLRSQLAWVERLNDPAHAELLARQSGEIQAMVRRLFERTPLAFLEDLTPFERPLFDNAQLRLLLSIPGETPVEAAHVILAMQRLASFDLIGLTERLEDFLRLLAFTQGWRAPRRYPRLNIGQQTHYARLNGAPETLQARLQELTRFDRMLYEYGQHHFERQMRALFERFYRDNPGAYRRKPVGMPDANALDAFLDGQALRRREEEI